MTLSLLTASDDLRHRPVDGGKGRDSLFFTLLLPEHELWVFVYTWVDDTGQAGRLVAIAEGEGTPPVYDIEHGIDMGGQDFDDWRIGGLELRHPEPLQTATVRYAGQGAEVAFDFTGSHEAFDYAQNVIGCPQWMARNRLEQQGHATGELTIGGRTVTIDGPVHRDHSWGRRDWRMPQHWKWVAAQTPSGGGLQLFQYVARGELGTNGYVLREGRPVGLVDARCEAVYDDDMTNRALRATLIDEDGGLTELELDRYTHMRLPVGSRTSMSEAGCHARIDGEPGAGQFEAQWPADYVEHLIASGR